MNALFVMAIALVVGVGSGVMARTRWILVPLLVSHVVGVEIVRLDVVAPSLAVRIDNTYGVVALVLTRGVHALLVVPPMSLGVLGGIVIARRLGWLPTKSRGRPAIGTAIAGVAVVSLAVLVAMPGSTPPVVGTNGRPVPGSIAELATVRLGGQDHAVMIRAANPDKPVLLYLAGGPGQSDLALTRAQVSGWEQDFVYVGLDQRGTGKSYAAIDPVSSMTVDRAVTDVIELTDYLRQRFGEQKVYLMGESWGTILGVLTIQRRPDLYYAWIPSGQIVNVVETDRRVYRDLVAYGRRVNDQALLDELRAIGEPPYADVPWANSHLLAWYEYLCPAYSPSDGYIARGQVAALDPFGVLGSEYNVIEKTNVVRGLIDTFAVIYPQLYGLDFRESATSLQVPVYFLDGTSELTGRREIALEWFDKLRAPTKQLISLENAAHSVAFEQSDQVQRLLNDTIVPATYRK